MKFKELDESRINLIDEWKISIDPKVPIQVSNYILRSPNEHLDPMVYDFQPPEKGEIVNLYDMITYIMTKNITLDYRRSDPLHAEWDPNEQENFTISNPLPHSCSISANGRTESVYVDASFVNFTTDVFGYDPYTLTIKTEDGKDYYSYYITKNTVIIFNENNHHGQLSIINEKPKRKIDKVISCKFSFDDYDIRKFGKTHVEYENIKIRRVGDGFYRKPMIFTSEGVITSNYEYSAIQKIISRGRITTITNAIYFKK